MQVEVRRERTARSGELGEEKTPKKEDAVEEDGGDRAKPEPRKRARAERGGETKLTRSAEQHGESNTTGHPRSWRDVAKKGGPVETLTQKKLSHAAEANREG
ncbi:hypothetical protein NDU88_001745 [Pleurodeles waltl]|uniref:Uncharacterized protein n=1 Tax=Pleurodeles waltl TaxID=8319 RepID=A0AAV7TJ77_PLEWA|nr:hypothetical protein NDU88_001745 [Pleurodeles waltl]